MLELPRRALGIRPSAAAWLAICGLLLARSGQAGQNAAPALPVSPIAPADPSGLPFAFDGPPPPVPPAVIARDAAGRATIRAVRLTAPLRIDGQLDEAVYASVPPISDFIQTGAAGGRAGHREDRSLAALRPRPRLCLVPLLGKPPGADDRQRDAARQRDVFQQRPLRVRLRHVLRPAQRRGVRHQRRSAAGSTGRSPTSGSYNGDWNPVWDVEIGRFDGGWTVEAAIPFKSLRYRPGRAQIWGFNARRDQPLEERDFVSDAHAAPAALVSRGILQVSLAATRRRVWRRRRARRTWRSSRTPSSNLTSDRTATPRISNDLGGDVGLDVKYGITQNLTADFTYNTDFAQVEADEQQVNLTRFNLFFPEKREFFLENQGTFAFGGAASTHASSGRRHADAVLQPAHRARARGRVVPIDGRRAPHGPGRAVQPRHPEHPAGRRAGVLVCRRRTSRSCG